MSGQIKSSSDTEETQAASAEQNRGRSAASPPADSPHEAEVLASVPARFCVHDEQTANWLVRRIVAAREYGDRVKTWADQEQRRAEQEENTLLYLFGRQLETWVREEIAKLNGKRKSLALPGGTLGFRKAARKLVIADERAVIAWAKLNCPDAVVVVEKLAKVIFDQYVMGTGHTPAEGVQIEPEVERFYIR